MFPAGGVLQSILSCRDRDPPEMNPGQDNEGTDRPRPAFLAEDFTIPTMRLDPKTRTNPRPHADRATLFDLPHGGPPTETTRIRTTRILRRIGLGTRAHRSSSTGTHESHGCPPGRFAVTRRSGRPVRPRRSGEQRCNTSTTVGIRMELTDEPAEDTEDSRER